MIDLQSILIYVGSLFLSMAFVYIGQKKNKFVFLLLAAVILTFVGGTKAISVGNDSESYYYNFVLIGQGDISNSWFEIGFVYLIYLIYFVFKDPQWCFVVIHFLIYFFLILRLWDFKKNSSLPVAFLSLYTIFFFFSLTGIRQSLAVSLVFYASRFIKKRNYLAFIIISLFASLFHRSAFIGLLLLSFELFEWKHLSKSQKIFLIACCAFSPILIYYSLSYLNRYEYYLGQTVETNIGLTLPLKIVFFVMTCILYFPPLKKEFFLNVLDPDNSYLISTTRIYYLIGIALTFTGYFVPNVSRIGLYFYIFEAVYFGLLFKSIKNTFILKISIITILITLFALSFSHNGEGVFPYKFFWQQA